MCICPQAAPAQSEAGFRVTHEEDTAAGRSAMGQLSCPGPLPFWPLLPAVARRTRSFCSSHEHSASTVHGRLLNLCPLLPACACLSQNKFLTCIWSPVINPGASLLGVGGFRLLPGPEMGSAEASRLGTSPDSLAGAGLNGVCSGAQRRPWWPLEWSSGRAWGEAPQFCSPHVVATLHVAGSWHSAAFPTAFLVPLHVFSAPEPHTATGGSRRAI